MIKTTGSLGREPSVADPDGAPRGPGGWDREPARPALRRPARMEPAAGILSPRPFPSAPAPPAPPAGPGPPPDARPGPQVETLAAPPAPDPGRLITDPGSGRTYFKGRLLGKVSSGWCWRGSGGGALPASGPAVGALGAPGASRGAPA